MKTLLNYRQYATYYGSQTSENPSLYNGSNYVSMIKPDPFRSTTFFYPVEYNVFGNSMSPKITYKFKNGVWKKHFKVYDYLGSLRFTLGEDKALLNYKQYEPYGETMLDLFGLTRQSYIGKEKETENNLGDHGVRKYDYETGRFNSIDPLFEKYYGWSPYQYSMNNPIWAKDWNGKDVRALDNQSRNDILNSLPSEIREQIVFSNDGLIDKESINKINVSDGNFNALKELVNSSVMTYVENRDDIIVKDMDGDGINDSYSMENAFKGFTATPTSPDGKYLSIYENIIHVQISKNSSSKVRAKYIGHELFGHALFFILGKDAEHIYQGGVDINFELKNFIIERENNSEINHDK